MKSKQKLPSMEIVQERLHVGDVVKNYKVLCKLLEVDELGGDEKVYQIEYFKRCFSFERKGHSYIITEVFDEVEPVEKTLRSDAVYERTIEIILLDFLRSRRGKPCISTYKEWFYTLGMVNSRYTYDANKTGMEHDEIKTPVILAFGSKDGNSAEELNSTAGARNYYAFFSRTSNYFSSRVKRAFSNLEHNRHLISSRKVYMIYDGNKTRIAEGHELELINAAYQETMDLFGIKEEYQIYQRSQEAVKRFYGSVNAHLKKMMHFQYQNAGVFPATEIACSDNNVDIRTEDTNENLAAVVEARRELNRKCYEWCNKNAHTYYNNLSEEDRKWYSICAQKDMADYYILLPDPLLE